MGTNARPGFAVLALVSFMPAAHATTSYITDGTFTETCSGTQTTCTGGSGQLGYNTNATGWTNEDASGNTLGYNFLFTSTSSATSGATGVDGEISLYNGNEAAGYTYTLTGAENGDGITDGAVPGGGNFIADDGAYDSAPISQTINNLTVGAEYVLGFYWAAAQQTTFTGDTSEQWQVTLGSQTQSTPVVDNASEGFSGWMYQTFVFTAASTTETLSFLSVGTPIAPSEPPFALLADVSLTQTPEPAPLELMLAGFGLIAAGALRLRRRHGNRA